MPGIVDLSNGPTLGERLLNMTLGYVGAKQAAERTALQAEALELDRQRQALAKTIADREYEIQNRRTNQAGAALMQGERDLNLRTQVFEHEKALAVTPEERAAERALRTKEVDARVAALETERKTAELNYKELKRANDLSLRIANPFSPESAVLQTQVVKMLEGAGMPAKQAQGLAPGLVVASKGNLERIVPPLLATAIENKQRLDQQEFQTTVGLIQGLAEGQFNWTPSFDKVVRNRFPAIADFAKETEFQGKQEDPMKEVIRWATTEAKEDYTLAVGLLTKSVPLVQVQDPELFPEAAKMQMAQMRALEALFAAYRMARGKKAAGGTSEPFNPKKFEIPTPASGQ